ncbi:hypothetical protein DFO83_104267 [Idiomarina loihiensis]|uniref:hypothetical protein n=1 Tax=Idiomarina TaxID=135575 RepID=UPI000D711423|nr:hypothetical protein [Idiomarina]PWW38567.1 hypothetical protein DFO83_104267 [Idiomarina loihiensis]TDP48359.1 hypothetical protein DET58_10436 [Idiomarina loihiensis]TDS23525.1 hypothetical protein DET62_10436 [Idiomarina sp. H2]
MSFKIPKDGSVLILDDKYDEAKPIIDLMAKQGVPCSYYNGMLDSLPNSPLNRVRLVFCDIEFVQALNIEGHASNIIRLLNTLVPENNGPYILILWTTYNNEDAEFVEGQIKNFMASKKPLAIIQLRKFNFIEREVSQTLSTNQIKKLKDSLSIMFDEYDVEKITNEIDDINENEIVVNLKKDAKENLNKEILEKLRDFGNSFQLFLIWEEIVNNSLNKTVNDFSTINEYDDYWDKNLVGIIQQLSISQLEKNFQAANTHEVVNGAMSTLNLSLFDTIEFEYHNRLKSNNIKAIPRKHVEFEKEIDDSRFILRKTFSDKPRYTFLKDDKTILNGVYEKAVNKHLKGNSQDAKFLEVLISCIDSYKPKINSKLLLDYRESSKPQPGSVYEKVIHPWNRKKTLLKSYIKDESLYREESENPRKWRLSKEELDSLIFIEAEVSPMCDYAQKKWIKHRIIPGLMIPSKLKNYLNIRESNSKIRFPSEITYQEKEYTIILDCGLLKSEDMEYLAKKKPIFRLRNETHSFILSNIAKNITRIGITFLS